MTTLLTTTTKKLFSINESNNVPNTLKVTHISSFAAVKHQMENHFFVLPLWRREEQEVSRGTPPGISRTFPSSTSACKLKSVQNKSICMQ